MESHRYKKPLWAALLALLVGLPFAASILRGEAATDDAKIAYPERKKVDPVATNGAIFDGWPKPDVALVFTGEQDGYLEPCGCAGLENQKGGLKRRFTMLKELRAKGWPLVVMDLGGQEKRTGVQAEAKTNFSYRALAKMGYDAVGFGPEDLHMDLLSIVINLDAKTNPLVSANVGIVDFDSGFTKRYKIVEIGGMRIGTTSVLGNKELGRVKNVADLTLLPPQQAIPDILGKLRDAKCDHLILLAHAEPDEAKALAVRFPEFDWVMTAHGADEPPKEPTVIPGTNSRLVEVGHKGMYAVVVGFYKEGATPFRYQRVPIDHRFADAPVIQQMHVEYQHQLKQLGLKGLGLKPTPHPSGRKFAGSKVCADCHTKATAIYEKTPHSHATETLVKRTDPPREFDPECLSCHATGWEAQKYFPFEDGFVSLNETPNLAGNGCENCHGPAAQHATAELGAVDATDEQKEELRAALRLKIADNEGNKEGQVYKEGSVVDMCMLCHDLDNSPEFDFQKYWPKVKHVGKE